jgi:hypothetical protein
VAIVNIMDVSSRDVSEERLWGCNMDLPVPKSQTEGYAMDVLGWVLGRRSPAIGLEIVSEGAVLRRVPIDIRRPDIVAAFPEVSGAEQSGFHTTIGVPVVTE